MAGLQSIAPDQGKQSKQIIVDQLINRHGTACPGEEVEVDSCRLMGYFKGSTAHKRKPAEEKAKTRERRANQGNGSEESNRDNEDQVPKNFNQAAKILPKNKAVVAYRTMHKEEQ